MRYLAKELPIQHHRGVVSSTVTIGAPKLHGRFSSQCLEGALDHDAVAGLEESDGEERSLVGLTAWRLRDTVASPATASVGAPQGSRSAFLVANAWRHIPQS